ncbi:hypothetical protein ACH5RR_031336 [Cinchona calisaya]|uniref:Uncharacterized protein n=1 Tax=Cinchona calisaya TaxID=153742 RepID=A0ABD2YHX0_9GENT
MPQMPTQLLLVGISVLFVTGASKSDGASTPSSSPPPPQPSKAAASLPRACNSEGVSIECQAMGGAVPIPAPGPTDDDGPQSPSLPSDPNVPTLTLPENTPDAEGDGTVTPPGLTPPKLDGFPTMTPPGVRPDLSTSQPSQRVSHIIMLALFGKT